METETTKRLPGRPPDAALQLRRREEILDRAAVVFAANGYTKADVQWIADPLGISKGTIYRYFPSKEELFFAAVRRGVLRLHEHIAAAKAGTDDPVQKIIAAVRAYLEFFKANPQLVELFIQERAEFQSRGRSVYFELRDGQRGPWREMIGDLIHRGVIRPMPVERVIDVLGDVMYGTMFTNHFAGREKPYLAQAQDILDVLFHGILTQPRASE